RSCEGAQGSWRRYGDGLRLLEANTLVGRPRQRPRLQCPRAPAAILLARAQERVARRVEAAGSQRDGAQRIASQRTLPRVPAAGMRLEHACGTLFRARGRPGRRVVGGLDEASGDRVARDVVALAAGAEPRVIGDEPE